MQRTVTGQSLLDLWVARPRSALWNNNEYICSSRTGKTGDVWGFLCNGRASDSISIHDGSPGVTEGRNPVTWSCICPPPPPPTPVRLLWR